MLIYLDDGSIVSFIEKNARTELSFANQGVQLFRQELDLGASPSFEESASSLGKYGLGGRACAEVFPVMWNRVHGSHMRCHQVILKFQTRFVDFLCYVGCSAVGLE